MSSDQETFLIVQHSTSSQFVNAFIWQGTYEDLYKLQHDLWHLAVFLLAPDPSESPAALGSALQRVEDIRPTLRVTELLINAGYVLRQLPDKQRAAEVKRAVERLQLEAESSLEVVQYPDTALGNLQRLVDRGVQPLTEDEMKGLRR